MQPSSKRRLERAQWPVRKYMLGQEPDAHVDQSATTEERLEAVWQLSVESWSVACREFPTYDRSSMPVRCVSLAEAEREDYP